jgi:hypothetical protein
MVDIPSLTVNWKGQCGVTARHVATVLLSSPCTCILLPSAICVRQGREAKRRFLRPIGIRETRRRFLCPIETHRARSAVPLPHACPPPCNWLRNFTCHKRQVLLYIEDAMPAVWLGEPTGTRKTWRRLFVWALLVFFAFLGYKTKRVGKIERFSR